MSNDSKLQTTRKESIKELIKKYKKLVDDTYAACTKELPTFVDIKNKDDEVTATAEEQLFKFINVRDKALDNADKILFKINNLEIELYAPELLKSDEEASEQETTGNKNWTKKKAAETK